MENLLILSDAEITKRISCKLKELRLKQNISRQDLAASSGVSTSSITRMEDGDIKSFESFLRILRTLGKMDIFSPLLQDELSPNEYYAMVHATKSKQRKRASRSNNTTNGQEESIW